MQINQRTINNKKSEIIFLIILGIISISLRFIGIDRPDFYFDEAMHSMAMKNFIATGNSAELFLFVHPHLFMLLLYIPGLLIGVNEQSLRLVEGFFGVLSVFVVYFLAKMWYGKKYAVLSSLLFAVATLPVLYSRLIYGYNTSMFFTIASIFSIEYLIIHKFMKKYELIMIFVSGILIGLTLLTRYNSLTVFLLYWIFVLLYSYLKEKSSFRKYIYYAFASNIIALLFFLIMVLVFGGLERLIYVINNFLFVILEQSTELLNPFYYHIALLFDGISPFLYFVVPIVPIYFIISKKRTRIDLLLLYMVFIFFIIISIQARRYSRHQLVIYPFLIILLSRFIITFFSNYTKKTKVFALSSFLILGSLSWTIYTVYQTHDFDIWSQVSDYIEKNYDSSVRVHAGYIRNRQIKTHLSRGLDLSLNISTLNKGDLVIFAFLYENSTILDNSPLEDKSTLFENKLAGKRNRNLEFGSDYYRYVLDHGKLVKTFEYKGGTSVWIYQINSTKDKNLYENHGFEGLIGDQVTETKLFGLWHIICGSWNKDNLMDRIFKNIASDHQKVEIEARCNKQFL